ncbi:lactate dehydrogenase [Levilactobacillus spicheri]
MNPKIMIRGGFQQVQALVQQLLIADLAVECVVVPQTPEEAPSYQAIVTASALCRQLTVRIGTTADYRTATWLVLVDADDPLPLPDQVTALRRLTSQILESGFQGQMIFAGQHDAILTTFAWKFSGAALNKLWGLGTYPLNQLLTHRLAERLGVGVDMIQTTVVGQALAPVVAWSRTYVGPTPILMYLANADAKFGADDLGKMASWLQRESQASQAPLRRMALIRLLARLLVQQAPIISVSHLQGDQPTLAMATPVLMTPQGTQPITKLALSEDEQRAYGEQVTALQTTMTQLEEHRMEGKG